MGRTCQNRSARRYAFLFVLVVALAPGNNIRAQNSSATPTPSAMPVESPSPNPSLITPPTVAPKVIGIEGHLELDVIIRVEIDHLAEWAAKNDPSKLVPYLNGLAIRGNYPQEIHASKNHLHFHLKIAPENKNVWTDLLGEPHGVKKPVAFSVGLENQSPFDSVYDQTHPLSLTVISPAYGVIALIVVLLTLILLIWLARTTNLIRDGGDCPVPGKLRPYNLGRAQMAFWFFLIYASYMTIWLITDALDTITGSLLALMGISAATALSEAMIDSGKSDASSNQVQSLSSEKQSLEQSIPAIQTQIDAVNAKATLLPEDTSNRDSLNKQVQDNRARLALVNQQLASLLPSAGAGVSRGFLRDVLSDATGYSFHRFQIFAWTIVLGIIFLSSVYNSLTMPEFSATLLGLMGLSSGTYIGFKFPEKN
jgi:ribose/xylose/arabinose/galactoside ABC-type transport system permease subunit